MKKILLVEDELSLRQLYAEFLSEAGYAVIEAADGDEAMTKINSVDWDILLLDIMLPKLDGMEVLKKLKAEKDLNVKFVIVLSNLENDTIIRQCLDLGAKEFLVKSDINPQVLLDAVQQYIPVK